MGRKHKEEPAAIPDSTASVSVPEEKSEPELQPDTVVSEPIENLELEREQPTGEQPAVRVRRTYKRRAKSEASEPGKRPAGQVAADKAVLALAFQGTFEALSMALGEHWTLLPAREVNGVAVPAQADSLAGVWDPVFERYGGKLTAEVFMWISASTVSVAILVPRIRVTVVQEHGIIGWIKRKLAARRARREA